MIPTPNLSCPIDTIRGTGAREFSGLGIIPWTRAFGPSPIRVQEARARSQTARSTLIWGIPVQIAYSRAGLVAALVPATELAAVVEERRPAPSPLLYERLDPRRGAIVVRARQQPGGEPGPRVLDVGRQDLGPVHAGRLDSLART